MLYHCSAMLRSFKPPTLTYLVKKKNTHLEIKLQQYGLWPSCPSIIHLPSHKTKPFTSLIMLFIILIIVVFKFRSGILHTVTFAASVSNRAGFQRFDWLTHSAILFRETPNAHYDWEMDKWVILKHESVHRDISHTIYTPNCLQSGPTRYKSCGFIMIIAKASV